MSRTKKPKHKKSKRTKPPIRTKSKRTKFKGVKQIQNFGGHLLEPPTECIHRKRAEDGGLWTDIGCCFSCDDGCERFNWYKTSKREAIVNDLKERGVKNC